MVGDLPAIFFSYEPASRQSIGMKANKESVFKII